MSSIFLIFTSASGSIELPSRLRVVIVEFDSIDSLNDLTPETPIEFFRRTSVLRAELDLRESLNAHALHQLSCSEEKVF